MIELLVLGALAVGAMVVFCALASVAAMIGWLVWLPFRMIGWMFKGVALLITLPFLLLAGVAAVVFFGFGLVVFFLPLLPFALITLFVVWLMRRRQPARPLGA